MKVRAKLIIDIETEFEGNDSSEETVRFCIQEDLQDNGYIVNSVEVYGE